ncbi:hypothetical protein ABZ697_31085 [Streptomyces albidoflavus]|uniref:hypothetical protein n=1 Tax=Streptomyces albidoflavus TaxID=1886 RepID=UPI0033D01754
MTPIHLTTGDDARLGGIDLTISLTPAQAKAISSDAALMADWVHSALIAMAMLRTGCETAGPAEWQHAITDVDQHLLPRVQGIRDALIRAHADTGGTVQALADAMAVARSTAQHRRQVVTRTSPSTWETWAKTDSPEPTSD